MNPLQARLLKLEANADNPFQYTVSFAVGAETYSLTIDAGDDEDGLSVEADERVEAGLDLYLDDELNPEDLTEQQREQFAIGGFADFFVNILAESGILGPIGEDELFGDDDEDGEYDEEE